MSSTNHAPAEDINEPARLAALHRYEILDTPVEAEFDDFTRLASRICDVPIALISLVDRDRQWFKSELGLGVKETPREVSFCQHALRQRDLLVVPDATQDGRFKDNPLVTGKPQVRFYAGALLESSDGLPLGTLCVLDHRPRTLTPVQDEALRLLARQIMVTLELRLAARQLALRNAELETARQEIKTLEGVLAICAKCKKIRDERKQWVPLEKYFHEHADVDFTHGLCPTCAQACMTELDRLVPRQR